MSSVNNLPLIIILGPTAVGKTELSLRLAEKMEGEIISADSRLFYRGMDIGTAKPSIEDRKRVIHHLIDIANPDDDFSLALFQFKAKNAIKAIHRKGKIPFLVGGTGQYIKAVIEEWQPPAQPPNFNLRNILEKWAVEIGVFGIHDKLKIIDPIAAESIQPQNIRRTVRALEVIFQTGKRFSSQKVKGNCPYKIFQIGLIRTRMELYKRIDDRIDQMISEGFIEEVKGLLIKGYSPHLPSMSAIGYKQVAAYINGEITIDEAVILMRRLTRQFVRRQANWFKLSNPDIHWYQPDGETNRSLEEKIFQAYQDSIFN